MSSYFVMPGSIDKVLAAFARGLAAGPTRPIDLFVREEAQAGRLRLGCIFPFITTPYHVDGALPTTIPDREANTAISRAVLSLLSYSFFIDRHLSKIPTKLSDKVWPGRSEHADLISGVISFMESPEYSPF